jgi:hypothetical protein
MADEQRKTFEDMNKALQAATERAMLAGFDLVLESPKGIEFKPADIVEAMTKMAKVIKNRRDEMPTILIKHGENFGVVDDALEYRDGQYKIRYHFGEDHYELVTDGHDIELFAIQVPDLQLRYSRVGYQIPGFKSE